MNVTKIAILGYRGEKDTGEVSKELLRVGYDFVTNKGFDLLGISQVEEINLIETTGIGLIGAKIAERYNVVPIVRQMEWKTTDAKENHRQRLTKVIDSSDAVVLFTKEKYAGGQNLLDCLSETDKPVLVFDLINETYVLTTGKNLSSDMNKPAVSYGLDYKEIAQFLLDKNPVCLDLETTGVNNEDDPIEISVVNCKTGYVYFHSFIYSDLEVKAKAFEVNGITKDKYKNAPKLQEIFPILAPFLSNVPVIAYNAQFDYKILKNALKRAGIQIPVLSFHDAMPLAVAKLGTRTAKLADICDHFGIKRGKHDTTSDCQALAEVVRKLAE